MRYNPSEKEWRDACEDMALVIGCHPGHIMQIDFPPDSLRYYHPAIVHLANGSIHKVYFNDVIAAKRKNFYTGSHEGDSDRKHYTPPPPRNPDHLLFRVGDIVTRDGTDLQRITKKDGDGIYVMCIREPAERWCRIGDEEFTMAEDFGYPEEFTIDAVVNR